MIICVGPVCIPLHLLLPFLITLAHQRGYLKWFKREWVTFPWWRQQVRKALGRQDAAAAQQQQQTELQGCSKAAAECSKAPSTTEGVEGTASKGGRLQTKAGSEVAPGPRQPDSSGKGLRGRTGAAVASLS
ncbi:hypothetical protein D9Q98_005732 [Chlorella vulgaris]|uniref:Uncharacterized protein n=1 Tax=Chlorella vulgaris TaxID=3077 RepID=A0A9D4TMI8_CHLVU|nr:hypothetical protein D9Q98_005732 [Chlorella vulgaris]